MLTEMAILAVQKGSTEQSSWPETCLCSGYVQALRLKLRCQRLSVRRCTPLPSTPVRKLLSVDSPHKVRSISDLQPVLVDCAWNVPISYSSTRSRMRDQCDSRRVFVRYMIVQGYCRVLGTDPNHKSPHLRLAVRSWSAMLAW